MALKFKSLLVLTLINLLCQIVGAKVFMVLMEDDPVITYTASLNSKMNGDEVENYKQKVINRHDIFLESLLPSGSYTKLYSYTHLLNGFAIHTSSERAMDSLQDAKGVRVIQEDIKLMKMTTHTPDYLGLPSGVWPVLGGADYSGEGVVIGMIDTGINPDHPSFSNSRPWSNRNVSRFRGRCEAGNGFSSNACNGKIVGAQHFARAAIAAGDFNSTHDYASAFDADGHGSHTASTAAGNYRVAVLANGYNYGYASGMAPGAHIAVYKAVFSFGGYMSDVVAAVDKAVEDGVDILNLSIGPSSVPPGPASFLNILEMELLFATKAGVLVVQAVGNGGPSPSSILSFSPWIMSVAASTIDRKYNNSVLLGSGKSLSGTGLSPPTSENQSYPLAAAEDVCIKNASFMSVQNCQEPNPFIPSLARNKIIICSYSNDFAYTPKIIDSIANTIKAIGAVGFIFTMDRGVNAPIGEISLALSLPGIVINTKDDAQALWDYYDSGTIRGMNGGVVRYGATARINEGRNAIYTGRGPMVASYSSRGPDVNNVLMQTADVLKPNILAPGNSIWAAWSPEGTNDQYTDGQDFAMMSGTSMATPHVSGIAAMIKQRHPTWSPATIASAIMTSANTADSNGVPTLAQHTSTSDVAPATPFDYGAGTINPTRAIDPGLIFDIQYNHFVQFLCTVPGVDDESVRRAVGSGCPSSRIEWGSDLNTASVTVANLVGSRRVYRRVTSVGLEREKYSARVRLPLGVGVTVTPDSFTINPNGTRAIRIDLVAKDLTNMYTFGEIAFHGDRDHVVRIPLTVFISSTLSD